MISFIVMCLHWHKVQMYYRGDNLRSMADYWRDPKAFEKRRESIERSLQNTYCLLVITEVMFYGFMLTEGVL